MSGDTDRATTSENTRWRRWLATVRFAGSRITAQFRQTPRRTAVTVGLIAITIALLVIVTGLSVALADDTTDDEAAFRVVPDQGGTLSPVVEVEGPRFSDVHDRTATIDDRDDVEYATPVLMEIIRVQTPEGGEPVNVLAIGIVPGEESPAVGGVSTDTLEPGDPHYADGNYDGQQTGDVVLSSGAADQLNASEADPLFLMSPHTGVVSQSHEVTAINDTTDSASLSSELPVIVLRLSELQSLSGSADEDLADQVLVETDSADAEASIEETYPDATIESEDDAGLAALQNDDLALATSLVALVVGIGICTLFVTTASALVVERERRTLAVLAAVGFPTRSRLAIVTVLVLGLTVAGGLCGIVLGFVGIALVNYLATATVTSAAIATIHPAFVPYALGVAIGAGVLAMPYPLYLTAKMDVISELSR